jgi:hypothetical protein|tara:strand:+ start:118 stop:246 length:129 start_codon:yes stop_codon:yes gene_type:complete
MKQALTTIVDVITLVCPLAAFGMGARVKILKRQLMMPLSFEY